MIKSDFDRVFCDGCDALLTPVTCGAPTRFKEINHFGSFQQERIEDFFTQPANMAGVPAIAIPFAKTKDDLPLGVQIMANFLNDGIVLDIAQQFDKYRQKEGILDINKL